MKLLFRYYLRNHKCGIEVHDYVDIYIEPLVIYRGSYTLGSYILGYLNNSFYIRWPDSNYRHCVVTGN